MPFTIEDGPLEGLKFITPKVFSDDRGFFMEMYKASDFFMAGITDFFIQDNFSQSTKGVLRGLHYQLPPFAQGKLIRCIHGGIYDVAVDIRRNSPTFGQWFGLEMSADDYKMIYIPAGFAHGFYTVSDIAEVVYKTTAEYTPDHDRGILWSDPDLNIGWPGDHIILSPKDEQLPLLKNAEVFA